MENLYDKYEGKILSAIDRALGRQWFNELNSDVQECIHDELYGIFERNVEGEKFKKIDEKEIGEIDYDKRYCAFVSLFDKINEIIRVVNALNKSLQKGE